MASQRIITRTGDADPADTTQPGADPERAGASDLHAELHAALAGDPARELRFWRARAEELAAQLERVQARLLALTEHLPMKYAPLLTCDPADLRHETDWPDPLAGWRETVQLEPAEVASELPRLWERLQPLSSR